MKRKRGTRNRECGTGNSEQGTGTNSEVRRLRAQLKKARATEARSRYLLDNTPQFILTLDRQGAIVSANHGLDGSVKETLTRKMDQFIVPDDRALFRRFFKAVAKAESRETRILRAHLKKGQGERWYEMLLAPLPVDGKNDMYMLTCTDVTKRKQAEEALRESETKFRNVTEQSSNMIFINQGGKVVYANRKCSDVMGYTREEFYSETFDFLKLIAPEHRAVVMTNFKRHARGLSVPPFEYDLITKAGERMNVVISTERLVYEGAFGILGTVTDITSQKRTELQLKESARELTTQKTNLQEKNAALKEIFAQIEAEKEDVRKRIQANVDKFVRPVVRDIRLRNGSDLRTVELLEDSLRHLTSEVGARAHKGLSRLGPREIEICNMIRSNMASKEIAVQLGISLRTVETHRNHIRKKLGISKKDVNFATYLQNLE